MNQAEDAFGDMAYAAVQFLPKLLAFLLILAIGLFIAKMIANVADKALERVGFDRAVERGGIKKALAKSQYDPSSIVGKIIFWALALVVLQMAFGVFGPNPVSDLIGEIIAFLPRLLLAIIILVVAAAIAAAVRELISNTLGGLSYGRTLANVAAGVILFLGIIAALNQIGIAESVTTPLLWAVLISIVGIVVVGVGGGLIKPMQSRWEGALETLAEESKNIREEAKKAPSLQEQAQDAKAKVEQKAHEAKAKVDEADAKADAELAAQRGGGASTPAHFPDRADVQQGQVPAGGVQTGAGQSRPGQQAPQQPGPFQAPQQPGQHQAPQQPGPFQAPQQPGQQPPADATQRIPPVDPKGPQGPFDQQR